MQISQSPPKEIGILLFPDFSNHCLANTVEPLRAANSLARRTLYRWQFLGLSKSEVISSSGLPVTPECALSDHPGGAMLLVMPSYGHTTHTASPVLTALRAAERRFACLAGLDTGSWLLAAAGLLDGHPATIHWDVLDQFAEAFPDVDVVQDRFILGTKRASCGGGVTALEMMLAMIARDHGAMLALEVGALFMHGERAPGAMAEAASRPGQIVQAAAALMRRNIEEPLSLPNVAKTLGLSQRTLEAYFKRETGQSPAAVYRALRLAEARRLTEQTRLSVSEIATRCGYDNASAMTRAFRLHHGTTPREMRAL